jgi:hypothetical protein
MEKVQLRCFPKNLLFAKGTVGFFGTCPEMYDLILEWMKITQRSKTIRVAVDAKTHAWQSSPEVLYDVWQKTFQSIQDPQLVSFLSTHPECTVWIKVQSVQELVPFLPLIKESPHLYLLDFSECHDVAVFEMDMYVFFKGSDPFVQKIVSDERENELVSKTTCQVHPQTLVPIACVYYQQQFYFTFSKKIVFDICPQ